MELLEQKPKMGLDAVAAFPPCCGGAAVTALLALDVEPDPEVLALATKMEPEMGKAAGADTSQFNLRLAAK